MLTYYIGTTLTGTTLHTRGPSPETRLLCTHWGPRDIDVLCVSSVCLQVVYRFDNYTDLYMSS